MTNAISPPVLTGILGGSLFLLIATIFVGLLRLRSPEKESLRKVMRIIGGWWIIGGVLSFALLLGQNGLIFLFMIASLLGLKEFLNAKKSEYIGTTVLVILSLVTMAHYLFLFLAWKNFFLFIVPVVAFVYLPFFLLAKRKVQGLLYALWNAQSALMLCVYLLSFAPGILFLNDSPTAIRKVDPLSAFLFLFFVTELNDVFQFVSGKLFGRTKLVPELSPNKTFEGFLGGIVLTTLLSIALAPVFLELNTWQSAFMGTCLALSGISGDLMFSLVKRTYNIKDFSELIPGHGGVLDRLDSIIFTAPTLYSVMYLFIH